MSTGRAADSDIERCDRSGIGQLVLVGTADGVKDQVNPDLKVSEGSVVAITVINGRAR